MQNNFYDEFDDDYIDLRPEVLQRRVPKFWWDRFVDSFVGVSCPNLSGGWLAFAPVVFAREKPDGVLLPTYYPVEVLAVFGSKDARTCTWRFYGLIDDTLDP